MTSAKIIPRESGVRCVELHIAAQRHGCIIRTDGAVLYLVRERRRPDLRVVGKVAM